MSYEHGWKAVSSAPGAVGALMGVCFGIRAASLMLVRKLKAMKCLWKIRVRGGALGSQACGKRATAKPKPYGGQMSLKLQRRQIPTVNT